LHVFHKNNETAGYCSVLHAMQIVGSSGTYGRRLACGASGRGTVRRSVSKQASLTQQVQSRSMNRPCSTRRCSAMSSLGCATPARPPITYWTRSGDQFTRADLDEQLANLQTHRRRPGHAAGTISLIRTIAERTYGVEFADHIPLSERVL
jgi:hypothetical protein